MKKKEIPLKVVRGLKSIKDIIKKELEKYDSLIIESESSTNMKVVDSDMESNFYFEIYDFKLFHGDPIFCIKYAPANDANVKEAIVDFNIELTTKKFDKWRMMIEEYNSIQLSPDEKILKAYEEEFYVNFEIIDDGSESEPFNLQQQLFLENYLENIEKTLEDNNEDNSVTPIIEETKQLRESLTSETKKSAIRKLSRILSKIRKHGLKLLNGVFTQAKNELIKKIIQGSFEGVENLLN